LKIEAFTPTDGSAMTAAAGPRRLDPVKAPYDAETERQLAKWMPPGGAVEPLALFRTLALHGELMSRMRPLGAGILGARATVPPRLREVMIHRTCGLTGAEYEWGVHAVAFGAPLGLDDGQLESTVNGGHDDGHWEGAEALVFRLADELHETSAVSDELWGALAAALTPEQIIELIVTAGWYHVIAYVCNGVRVEHEDWARSFPG
jgi:alkylhydroperoxidase family enzyme